MLSTQIRIKNFFPNTRYNPRIILESKIIREILFFMRKHFKQPSTGARKLQNFLSPPFISPPHELRKKISLSMLQNKK